MPVRAAAGVEERLLDRAARYFTFADRFGWTPDQVDDQPAVLIDRLLIVAQVRDEVQAERDREATRG